MPLPNSPLAFQPQHHKLWSALMPHVCQPPVATETQSVPTTSTGAVLLFCVPLPKPPCWLSPQHHSVEFVCTPQVCIWPASTIVQPCPATCLGVDVGSAGALPSCPDWLSPQHHRVRSLRMPQLWFSPAATDDQFQVVAPARTGTLLSAVVPLPSCPYELPPQHHREPSAWTAQLCVVPTRMSEIGTPGMVPWHTPAVHASPWVSALPSSQAVPSGFAGLLHAPVPGAHVPMSWH